MQWSLLYPLVFPAALALVRYTRELDGPTVHYAAPLYYYRNEHHRRLFALFYLLHPALSLFHYSRREFGEHTYRSVLLSSLVSCMSCMCVVCVVCVSCVCVCVCS